MNEEQLLEFLYIAPVALIQFDDEGAVKLANPRVAQLFNRYAPGGYFANFFEFLKDVLPELKEEIQNFDAHSGQVMENSRYCIDVPTEHGNEELWLDVTIMRQDEKTFIGSLNNVTNQVKAELEKYVVEQKMSQMLDSVSKHVIFTLDKNGAIDSWNTTGETYLLSGDNAVDKLLSQVLDISVPDNAKYLQQAQTEGAVKAQIDITAKDGKKYASQIYISTIHDQRKRSCGYSVVITLADESQ